MRYHRAVNVSTRVFIGLEAVLYIAFTLCDIFLNQPVLSSSLKFISISLCFIMTFIRLVSDRDNQDSRILSLAFLFTVTSDVFLLFTDYYSIGVFSFCIVQLIYLYRIRRIASGKLLIHVLLRITVSAGIIGLLAAIKLGVDFLLCITVFYFINFVGNIGMLVRILRQKHSVNEKADGHGYHAASSDVNIPIFLFGMILFILCDVSVGIFNLTYYIDLSGTVYQILNASAAFGMWGFYLPGQVCIALSTKERD